MVVNPTKQGKDARKVFTFNKVFGMDATQGTYYRCISISTLHHLSLDLTLTWICQSKYMPTHDRWWGPYWTDTMYAYLPTDRQGQGRHIRWYVTLLLLTDLSSYHDLEHLYIHFSAERTRFDVQRYVGCELSSSNGVVRYIKNKIGCDKVRHCGSNDRNIQWTGSRFARQRWFWKKISFAVVLCV